MKRIFDCVIATLILLLISPIFIIVACAIWHQMGTPIFFCQSRPGRHGRVFKMIKFRTMHETVDAQGIYLNDAERLTALGKFLRRSSLDELPELWNVLKGDMSIVGPRPLLVDYLTLYSEKQARRHEVRPGVTGWAQVNGRNAISWDEKFEMDVWYVDNQSMWLDLKIILRTIITVIKREGISASGEATISKFTGSGS